MLDFIQSLINCTCRVWTLKRSWGLCFAVATSHRPSICRWWMETARNARVPRKADRFSAWVQEGKSPVQASSAITTLMSNGTRLTKRYRQPITRTLLLTTEQLMEDKTFVLFNLFLCISPQLFSAVSEQRRESCEEDGWLHLCLVDVLDTGLFFCDREKKEQGVSWIFRRSVTAFRKCWNHLHRAEAHLNNNTPSHISLLMSTTAYLGKIINNKPLAVCCTPPMQMAQRVFDICMYSNKEFHLNRAMWLYHPSFNRPMQTNLLSNHCLSWRQQHTGSGTW